MIISPQRRHIFVHIPKTGGTAMALALEARAAADDIFIGDTPKAQRRKRRLKGAETAGRLWKHASLRDVEGLVSPAQMEDWFVWTLVRNPWDRLVSYYHWLRDQSFDHPVVPLAQSLSFSAFLAEPLVQTSFTNAPYRSYVTGPDGRDLARAYVRLEHLAEDLAPVASHLGFMPQMGRVNQSTRDRDWRGYYTDSTAALVGEICAADVNQFGYRFDP